MTPVKSSNIEAVGYDIVEQKLTVRFKGGATHCYEGVPPKKHRELMAADSVGSYFHANIRNDHKSSKVGDPK